MSARGRSLFRGPSGEKSLDQLRQFVVNTLVMQALIARNAGLPAILGELRYNVNAQSHPGLSGLPLVVIQSPISTFLPPESVIAAATELSGIDAFIELIDVEAVRQLSDPFKQRIVQMIPELL